MNYIHSTADQLWKHCTNGGNCLYTEPKKKLSQNRTSRWAYSLRKKKKSTPISNETEISNEINDFQTVHEL